MVRRSFWQLCAALAAVLALATPAFAGGWAVVTLDSLPSEIQAGQSLSLGFMVRQHGVTPIDDNPFESGPLAPILMAKNTATGEIVEANARKEGPLGHFVVDVTFPSAGSWEIEIIPPPFEGTKLGVFTVAAAAAKAPNTAQQGSQAVVGAESQPVGANLLGGSSLRSWWVAALVIGVALALTAFVQRQSLTRLVRMRNPVRPADEPQPAHTRTS